LIAGVGLGAGVSSRYKLGSSGEITAHYIKGDILSTVQDFSPLSKAAGTRVSHSGHNSMISIILGVTAIASERHMMSQFFD